MSITRIERTSEQDAPDRRRWERAELVVRVNYKTVDALFSEFARNINEGGLFIETDSPPPTGSLVELQFEIPGGDEPIQVIGRVVRKTEGDRDEPPGMGVEFGELDGAARERVNQLIRDLRIGTR